MSVARPHARAFLHVVLTVALRGPSFAAVVTGVRFEPEVDAEVVHHVAQLGHALWAVFAGVHFIKLTCFLIDDTLPFVMLGELFPRVIIGDTI